MIRARPIALYASTIFMGAFLLFSVQPLIARFLLPWFGGSAAVWTTCMLFFQVTLVLGYLYAWALDRYLSRSRQGALHAVLLVASLLLLPIIPPAALKPAGAVEPVSRILLVLARTIGLPYLLLSSTGPLLQGWFARAHPGRNPYRLFALSNLASLLALLSFPFLLEPHLRSRQQAWAWSVGYVLCAALAIRLALVGAAAPLAEELDGEGGSARPGPVPAPGPGPVPGLVPVDLAGPPARAVRALWILLPACGSTLLLCVTNFLTQDLASMPLLWVLPLVLYLLSFIVCFESDRAYRRAVALPLLLVALGVMASLRRGSAYDVSLVAQIALYSTGLFVVCVVCHGELARLRPHPTRLAAYYLHISIGGALGGVLVGVAAPLLLSLSVEMEIALGACPLLVVAALALDPASRLGRDPALGIGAFAVAVVFCVYLAVGVGERTDGVRLAVRNFYGSLRVVDEHVIGEHNDRRKLLHGSINHGGQMRDPQKKRWPTTYYCEDSGAGYALLRHHVERPRRIGIVGLGAGSLALYGRVGDTVRIYEINPLVIAVAKSEFSFITESPAHIEIVQGDARTSLEREPDQRFDVLLVDAFSGDSIPVHLLTREAFALYYRHLQPDGVLAVHISNRNVRLDPVMLAAGRYFGKETLVIDTEDSDEEGRYCFGARWVLATGDASFFKQDIFRGVTSPLVPEPRYRMWTDDDSNLFTLLK